MPSLYELTGVMSQILRDHTGPDGEFDPGMEAELGHLGLELTDKVESCCRAVRNLEAEETALRAESRRLAERAQVAANSVRRLKEYIRGNLERLEVPKMTAGLFKVAIVGNGGKAALEVTVKPDTLPEAFRTITVSANESAIRNALESGVLIEGARLLPRGSHLSIR